MISDILLPDGESDIEKVQTDVCYDVVNMTIYLRKFYEFEWINTTTESHQYISNERHMLTERVVYDWPMM